MPSSVARFSRRPHRRVGFAPVVELLLDTGDELLGEEAHADARAASTPPLELARREAQDRGVAPDDRLDAGPLDLHDDARAVEQHRPVGLPDRRGRERLEVERREGLLDRLAELGLERPRGPRPPATGPDLGAQEARAPTVTGLRQHVGAGRRDLAELHEHPAGVLEHEPQARAKSGDSSAVVDAYRTCIRFCLPRVVQHLAEPSVGREHRLHLADRVDEPPPQPPLRRLRPPRDQLEHDADRHRREHAEEDARAG